MTNVVQLKRRTTGNAGAPASLKSGEPAYNMVDKTLYIGHGDDGGGVATSIEAVGGSGAAAMLTGDQTIAGKKTFSSVPAATADASSANDLVRKSQIDTIVAAKAPLASPGLTGAPTAPTQTPGDNSTKIATTAFVQDGLAGKAALSHGHATSEVTGLDAALTAKAPLASPTLTGTPTAPTPVAADNSTKIATTAFVQNEISSFGAGDMAKSTYDTDNDGKVNAADAADSVPWTGITGRPSTFTPSAHGHATSEVTGLDAALAAKAPLASPALTGTPTAPTPTGGDASTKIATTAFVSAAVAALVSAAPGLLDTLDEIAAALGDDPNFATTMTTALAGKMAKSANLSDLTNASTARSNLGLASMAEQAASAVSITGGSIGAGVTMNAPIDGGTF